MRPLFKADWLNACFIHFEIEPALLQPHVPLRLDLLNGKAVVSLVAFHQERLRPVWGGRFAERLSAPLADHEFLNLRTYVRVDGKPAIFFLAEWIPSRLAKLIGPALYGLPYRLGCLHFDRAPDRISGTVSADRCRFSFAAQVGDRTVAASESAFLLERYVAYTLRHGRIRRFQIEHEPWEVRTARLQAIDLELIRQAAPWFKDARPLRVDFSDGVRDVGISAPQRMNDNFPANQLRATAV